MARINSSLWWKRENFFLNACDEEVSTSSGQVPATDAIGKEDVSTEKLVSLWEVEAEATWAVSWRSLAWGQVGGGGVFSSRSWVAWTGWIFLGRPKASMESGSRQRKALSG